MIEILGGVIGMVVVMLPAILIVWFLLSIAADALVGYVDDTKSSYFETKGSQMSFAIFGSLNGHRMGAGKFLVCMISAVLCAALGATAFVFVLVLSIDGKTQHELLLWPYVAGAWASPVLIPIAVTFGSVYTARILRRLQKKVVKLKDTLTDHMKNKDAHKAVQGDSE